MRQVYPDSTISSLSNTASAAGIVSSMTNQNVFTEMAEAPSVRRTSTMSRQAAGRMVPTKPFWC